MKKSKKMFLVGISVCLLSGFFPSVTVQASTAENGSIRVRLDASRPAVGNPRGTTTVTTLNANSQALGVRTTVRNSNNTISNPVLGWVQLSDPSGRNIANNTNFTSSQTIGGTRNGTVRGYGRSRTASNAAWTQLVATRTW